MDIINKKDKSNEKADLLIAKEETKNALIMFLKENKCSKKINKKLENKLYSVYEDKKEEYLETKYSQLNILQNIEIDFAKIIYKELKDCHAKIKQKLIIPFDIDTELNSLFINKIDEELDNFLFYSTLNELVTEKIVRK